MFEQALAVFGPVAAVLLVLVDVVADQPVAQRQRHVNGLHRATLRRLLRLADCGDQRPVIQNRGSAGCTKAGTAVRTRFAMSVLSSRNVVSRCSRA